MCRNTWRDGARVSVVPSDGTRGNRLKCRRCHLNSKKHFVTVGEVVESPSLQILTQSWAAGSGWHSLGRGVGPDDLQRSVLTSTILWFCVIFVHCYLYCT